MASVLVGGDSDCGCHPTAPRDPRLALHPKTHSLCQCHWENHWVGRILSPPSPWSPLAVPVWRGGRLGTALPPSAIKAASPGASPAPPPPWDPCSHPAAPGEQGWAQIPGSLIHLLLCTADPCWCARAATPSFPAGNAAGVQQPPWIRVTWEHQGGDTACAAAATSHLRACIQ